MPQADPGSRPVVRRLPGHARRRPDRRAAAARSCASSTGLETLTRLRRASGLTTASGGWSEAIRRLPAGELAGRATHDPYPGVPDGVPLTVKVDDRSRRRARSRSTCATTPTLRRRPERVPRLRTNNVITGRLQLDRPRRAAQRRQLPPHQRPSCARAASPATPRFPHSCSMATTNSPTGSVTPHPGRLRRAGRGVRARRGRAGMGDLATR